MNKLVPAYIFDASAKTVQFIDYEYIDLKRIRVITNVTKQTVLYSIFGLNKGGTVSGNTVTLDYDTTAMDDTDILSIYYDDPNGFDLVMPAQKPLAERYKQYYFSATTAGTIVGVQGKGTLGYINISFPGVAGSLVKAYDDYYQVSSDIIDIIDSSVVGRYVYRRPLKKGLFLVITSGGAAPHVTIGMDD